MKANDTTESERLDQLSPSDSPDVLVFPPLLPAGTFLLSLFLNHFFPLRLVGAMGVRVCGGMILAAGIALMAWGRRTMVRAGTNVPPHKPTLAIVTSGPFRFTRNPLYLGGSTAYIGLAVALNLAWPLILFAPLMLLLHWGIVRREESYLEAKFGDVYLAYKSSVRRWV